jgi:hypothetical protein
MSRARSGRNISSESSSSKVASYDSGRVCEREACTTVLSRYNKSPFCSVHEPRQFNLNPRR